ncbi:glutathione S-transferase family protein [Limibacillus halophilus]
MMKLFGNYLSPYTRRVAVALELLGLPYEQENLSVFVTPEPVAKHNPLVRIPTLLLEDGEAVFESAAILDALDQMVAPEKRLVPPEGKQRRDVLRLTALATGVMDKAVWAFYEGRFRPAEIVHQPWIDHNEKQVISGLTALEAIAKQAGDGWLAGTPFPSLADVSAGVMVGFVAKVRPNLGTLEAFPALTAFAARCEALPAFKATPVPEQPPQPKKD